MTESYKPMTLGQLANQAAERFGDREFTSFEGQRYSFADALDRINRTARSLVALGVQRGDTVGLWMTNRMEWIDVMFACAKIGAIQVPINTRFRTADLEYVIRQSDMSVLITLEQAGPIRFLDMVLEACPELERQERDKLNIDTFPNLKRVISLGDQRPSGVYGWDDLLAAGEATTADELQQREENVHPDDTLFIMYTSGTTGFPKGVMQPHGSLVENLHKTVDLLQTSGDDVTIMFLPLFHCFGYQQGPFVSMIAGCRMVLTETFDPAEVLELIESERGTMMHGFDTHWQELVDHPDFNKREHSTMRTGILAAGLPSTVPVAEKANRLLCHTISGWGMTEVLAGAAIGHLDDSFEQRTSTSGWAMDGNEFKIIDPATGETLPPGTQGELCMRGFSVMQGYYNKPEETAKTIDADGWLHSGDRALLHADGSLRFLGRYKEMLKVGGENVDPVEVEAYFLRHPGVSRIQIVGVPDTRLSEVAVAFVAPEPGESPSAEELTSYAKGKLASFKLPRHFFFVDDYPMTPSGKVKKFELRKLARAQLGIEGEDIEQPVSSASE